MNCARCKQPIMGSPFEMGGSDRFCEPCAVIRYRVLVPSYLDNIWTSGQTETVQTSPQESGSPRVK